MSAINVGRIGRYLPDTLLQTRAKRGCVHLTIDDGPHPEHTVRLAELLGRYQVPATFFCIGQALDKHRELGRWLIREGHQLGNHSWWHKDFFNRPLAAQIEEVENTDALIRELGGVGKRFRPPRGKIGLSLLWQLYRRDVRVINWNYDSMDYGRDAAQVAAAFASRSLRHGDIVLLHDDYPVCIDVLEEWLPRWKQQGLNFDRV